MEDLQQFLFPSASRVTRNIGRKHPLNPGLKPAHAHLPGTAPLISVSSSLCRRTVMSISISLSPLCLLSCSPVCAPVPVSPVSPSVCTGGPACQSGVCLPGRQTCSRGLWTQHIALLYFIIPAVLDFTLLYFTLLQFWTRQRMHPVHLYKAPTVYRTVVQGFDGRSCAFKQTLGYNYRPLVDCTISRSPGWMITSCQ